MLVTSLNILLFVLKSVEVLAVITILLIGIDLAFYMYKDSHPTPRAKRRFFLHTAAGIVAGTIRMITEIKLYIDERSVRKEQIRVIRAKEAEAHEGFFEDSYVVGFDSNGTMLYRGCQVLSEKGVSFNQAMDDIDKLMDARIFDNTKEV